MLDILRIRKNISRTNYKLPRLDDLGTLILIFCFAEKCASPLVHRFRIALLPTLTAFAIAGTGYLELIL